MIQYNSHKQLGLYTCVLWVGVDVNGECYQFKNKKSERENIHPQRSPNLHLHALNVYTCK